MTRSGARSPAEPPSTPGAHRRDGADRESVAPSEQQAQSDRQELSELRLQGVIDRALIAELLAQGQLDQREIATLRAALLTARRIGAALGIVMAGSKVDEPTAFELLRRVSQNTNRKLRDVADDVVYTGTLTGSSPDAAWRGPEGALQPRDPS